MAQHLMSAGSARVTIDSNDNLGSCLSMSNNTVNVCMQAPAGGGVTGAAAIPAAAAVGNDAVSSMEPVQRECWSIYNNPDAQARESGISIDEVTSVISCAISGQVLKTVTLLLAICFHVIPTLCGLIQQLHTERVGMQAIGQLNGKFSVPAIRQAIDWLANEGHLYTTHDDQHFKSTAM